MPAKIINGREISNLAREEIMVRAAHMKNKLGISPKLSVVKVGNDPASETYVRNKRKACEECGILCDVIEPPTETTTEQIENIIQTLSEDKNTHGILVQLPLPEHIDEKKIISLIPPEKDVDAFHPQNVGKIMIGEYNFLPCTPAGVMKMLEYENISVDGKICVVVGRSNIVGKPMSMLLLNKNGTVVTCHSHTKNLPDITKQADILVSCVGKKGFITADMVKSGAVVIDVGINRDENGKICGDVDFDSVKEKASAITPVPGGVGVMTVTMLLENTLRAAEKQTGCKMSWITSEYEDRVFYVPTNPKVGDEAYIYNKEEKSVEDYKIRLIISRNISPESYDRMLKEDMLLPKIEHLIGVETSAEFITDTDQMMIFFNSTEEPSQTAWKLII